MAEEKKEAFLHRWSRRKHEQKDLPVKEEEAPAPSLPPLDKLTPESDYTGFMHPKVEDALRRVALKKLFKDPHFNTPDPFEPFSGDWTGGEAISDEMLKTLNQARTHLFSEEKEKEAPPEEEKTQTAEPPQEDEPRRQDT
ncbi:MAG TPA: DUF3306 domain-containing protein [Burkholderiales bacterium]|nr:DUF3306 domain-containing protein [Burkholderiales bacterium]